MSGDRAHSPWPAVWGLYLLGVFAAAQLGKMSALAPLMARDLALSLTTVAAAISLLEAGGATLGGVAGRLAQRIGLRATLRIGVACLALGGLATATAQGAASLLGWRLIEAAGYLGVVISAPVMIAARAAAAGPRAQAVAMALWSSFVPVGLALGAWAWAGVASGFGWRAALLAGGLIGALALIAAWHTSVPGAAASPAQDTAGSNPAVRWLALGFGAYTLFEVGMLALLPTLLVERAGLGAAAAGQWSALAALATIAGSAAAAWLLRHGAGLRGPMGLSLLLPALLLFGVFSERPDARVALTLAIVLNMVSGAYASLAFALLPVVAGGAGRMTKAIGWITQCGASGALIGPPLMAAFVERFSWSAAAWCGLVASVLSALLTLRALASAGPSARANQAGH
ncbi:MAG: MFS transporter [Burkholderiales bacterium]|nr:MFS transporter [Burkholderiales bacterium]